MWCELNIFHKPKVGQIDGSVLSAVGLLLLFATSEKIPEAIKAGKSIKVQKGDFSAEVNEVNTETKED